MLNNCKRKTIEYLQINACPFPYQDCYHPEKPISARGLQPEGRYRSRDDNNSDMEKGILKLKITNALIYLSHISTLNLRVQSELPTQTPDLYGYE